MNILSFPLHPISDQDFCSISPSHHWYFLTTKPWGKGWNTMISAFPKNAQIINAKDFIIPSVNWTILLMREKYLEPLNIDLVLAPAIESCYFALQFGYPTIHYCNFIATDIYGHLWFDYLIKYHPEIPLVFVSEENARMSEMPEGTYQVIDRGWDPQEYKEWKGDVEKVLMVCTSMKNRPYFDFYSLYQKLASNLPTQLVGYNNPWAGHDAETGKPHNLLKEDYSKYRLLFNIEPLSGRTMYEALASGIPVVSVERNDSIRPYIKNGVNAFMSKDINYLINCAKELLKNKELAQKIGKEGQKIIQEHFHKDKYKAKWDTLFSEVVAEKK